MTRAERYVIVGAGLSGLYAAYLLEQHGIQDVLILEARSAIGGRILSVSGVDGGDPADAGPLARFDLGPSWYWPGYQPQLEQLVQALGLTPFPQFDDGDMLIEYGARGEPARAPGYQSAPPSMRLHGGMAALIDALHQTLRHTRIAAGQTVLAIRRNQQHIDMDAVDAQGWASTRQADRVLLALPPRLVQASIQFEPALPVALSDAWRQTPTWMAAHAKYLAVFDTPFWRDQGLSGAARSMRGPLTELHDASLPEGPAALFGFFGMSATARAGLGDDQLLALCRAQLIRLFGPQAAHPQAEFIKDWSRDPLTATKLDVAGYHHPAPPARAADGPWRDSLAGVGSEWSPQFPGYLAGAVEAAGLGVEAMLGGR